jgi:hypothetical protein
MSLRPVVRWAARRVARHEAVDRRCSGERGARGGGERGERSAGSSTGKERGLLRRRPMRTRLHGPQLVHGPGPQLVHGPGRQPEHGPQRIYGPAPGASRITRHQAPPLENVALRLAGHGRPPLRTWPARRVTLDPSSVEACPTLDPFTRDPQREGFTLDPLLSARPTRQGEEAWPQSTNR